MVHRGQMEGVDERRRRRVFRGRRRFRFSSDCQLQPLVDSNKLLAETICKVAVQCQLSIFGISALVVTTCFPICILWWIQINCLLRQFVKLQYNVCITRVVASGNEICLNPSHVVLLPPMGTPLLFATTVVLRLYIVKCKTMISFAL
nr:uncharacterized protein LOC127304367 isoform X2 [Lolium perenne]